MARRSYPLCFAHARIARRRFELSALNETAVIYVICGLQFVLPLVGIFGVRTLLGWVAVFLATFSARRVLIVTADGAVFEHRFFGVVLKRQSLGIAPTVENRGWDWDELAIVPRDPALRRGLQDDERAVLFEWTNAARARRLETLARSEIMRLHAHHLAPSDYRKNARAW